MEIQPILIVRMPSHKTEDEVANVFLDFEDDEEIAALASYFASLQ